MAEAFAVVLVLLAVAALLLWRAGSLRRRVLSRVGTDEVFARQEALQADHTSRMAAPPLLWPWWLLVVVGVIVSLFFGVPRPIAMAAGLLFAILVWIIGEQVTMRRTLQVDEQLAGAIDLIVSSVRAGLGFQEAVETASKETRSPVGPWLGRTVSRLRLGEEPAAMFSRQAEMAPTQGVRFFSFTLAVRSEVGGSVAAPLAELGRSIRHRIEYARRVRSQSTEAQASLIAVLGITYGLLALMWRAYPERVEGFLGTEVGVSLVASAILLQSLGLIWMARLTRLGQ